MFRRLWIFIRIIWAIGIMSIAMYGGAAHGWVNHGLTGAIALGFCGLVIGAFFAGSLLTVLEVIAGGL